MFDYLPGVTKALELARDSNIDLTISQEVEFIYDFTSHSFAQLFCKAVLDALPDESPWDFTVEKNSCIIRCRIVLDQTALVSALDLFGSVSMRLAGRCACSYSIGVKGKA